MKKLLIFMTIVNTVMFIGFGSPFHAIGAAVGAIYLLLEGQNEGK